MIPKNFIDLEKQWPLVYGILFITIYYCYSIPPRCVCVHGRMHEEEEEEGYSLGT